MSISIGVVGKPNAGKSTFFSALTMADAKIAPFPFTTIEPNKATAHIRKPCPHTILGKQCHPRDSSCINGIRFVPILLTDVAGLVPDAHLGRGLGLQFLDDLRQADALIQVVDASGRTDLEGNPSEGSDPAAEVEFLEKEITYWIAGILEKNWAKMKGKSSSALYDIFASMKISHAQVEAAILKLNIGQALDWDEEQRFAFAAEMRATKPIFIAANKADSASAENVLLLLEKFPGRVAVCSAAYELALRKAAKAGIIEYLPGQHEFAVKNASPEQQKALERIAAFLKEKGSCGVQEALEAIVTNTLGLIAAYPVEDEHKWCDRKGEILPNVFLLPKGSTTFQMAERVHTDLAKNFITAIDAKRKMRVGKEFIVNDGDVIKIVSG